MKRPDATTRKWIRDAADERAASRGCRFNRYRAEHVCSFFESELVLYEGEYAGQPFRLMDWQREFLWRLFGWERYSEQFGRWLRRFRKASLWVPKKNGKSPLAAGIGLYLLAADGEQGQKVFSAAKDGKQAGIVHMHARQMVIRSPNLSGQCTINHTTGRIAHLPTASFYSILAGDNIEGQEGLNGSVIIDETHVVDDRLAKVLEYMGASRSEPLQVELSTAGKDPECYGKHQWDYGRDVAAGLLDDDQFLYVAYSAPQDATDEALESRDTWKKANPSWGTTINPEEFASSWKRSKRSPADRAMFTMYRLNIWANTSNPWLHVADWLACRDRQPPDLRGRECIGGLDLSRTRDLSAFSLVFQDQDSYHVRCQFWLPEDRATELEHVAPFRSWAAAGWLKLTPGNVIDYDIIEEDIAETLNEFRCQRILYDPRFAEELTQRLEHRTGIERMQFAQGVTTYSGPIAEFERCVVGRKFRHDGNPVLAWQVGHAHVKDYPSRGRMIMKDRAGSAKTVDGVVATIMALAGCSSGSQRVETYSGPLVWT